jgi:hypothetical protein
MSAEKSTESDTETLSAMSDGDTESPEETAVIQPQRDPITGQFLPGNKGGGRPKGAKDKVSTRLVDLMTDLMNRRGEELLERIADSSPSDALAILTRIVPQAELQRIFLDGDGKEGAQVSDITINLISKAHDEPVLPPPDDGDPLGIEQAQPSTKH